MRWRNFLLCTAHLLTAMPSEIAPGGFSAPCKPKQRADTSQLGGGLTVVQQAPPLLHCFASLQTSDFASGAKLACAALSKRSTKVKKDEGQAISAALLVGEVPSGRCVPPCCGGSNKQMKRVQGCRQQRTGSCQPSWPQLDAAQAPPPGRSVEARHHAKLSSSPLLLLDIAAASADLAFLPLALLLQGAREWWGVAASGTSTGHGMNEFE